MASQMKISFLRLLVAVLLLCGVLGQRSSSRRTFRRPASRFSSGRIRRKESRVQSPESRVQSPGSRVQGPVQVLDYAKYSHCKDETKPHDTCVKLVKELGLRVCHTKIEQLKAKLERSCAKTCHYCGEPMQGCRQSQYGCCWDAYTPREDLYSRAGCPVCKDHMHLCRRFKRFCYSRKSENKAFMELHCPVTCNKCVPKGRVKRKGQRINMADWSKL